MRFGTVAVDEAEGGILAHSLRLPDDTRLAKGTVLDDELIDLLHAASMETVTVALLEPGDVPEDEAARRIADRLLQSGIRADTARTGRVNLFATRNGVFRASREIINELNGIDPGITVATLDDFSEVNAGRMVATVKIIPYAVSGASIEQVEALRLTEAMTLAGFRPMKVGLIQTQLPGTKPSVLRKTEDTLQRRLVLSGSTIANSRTVLHQAEAVRRAIEEIRAGVDIIILFGASAISDAGDIIPAAIRDAGGEVLRFGMPVDPGNLLLLGKLDDKPVIGAPGCARGKAENGFDWVLQRILADIAVAPEMIAGLGVGGLLMETGARPHPRESRDGGRGGVAALVLAAGQSRRMGDVNKMTVPIAGKPMVRHVVEAAVHSNCAATYVVTGFQRQAVHEALAGCTVRFVDNPEFEEGLSTSLRHGIGALAAEHDRVLVLLGDMPFVSAAMINRLVEASQENRESILVSTSHGKRGNPVLWPAKFFPDLLSVQGDNGARHIIGENAADTVEIELGEAAGLDLDTPTAVAAYREKGPGTP